MHHRDYPDVFPLLQINDCKRKFKTEMSPDRGIKLPETIGVITNLPNQLLNFTIETNAQIRGYLRVVFYRLCEGMRFVDGRPETLRRQLQCGRKMGHHRNLLAAKPAGGLREMLEDCTWSSISVSVNEHRRKAPTWGPPRIPECM